MENTKGKANTITSDIARENELNLKLDKKWLERAEKELDECEESRAIKLRLLEERIVQDKDIPNARRDDAFLLRFLRAKKFDVDKSFRMIQKYFKMKSEAPDLFRVSPMCDMQNVLKMQMQTVLSQPDENGSVIYLFRLQNCDPYKWPAEMVFRSNIMALENAIRDPCTQIGGLVVMLDMAGLKLAHAKFLSPNLAKRSAEVIQDSFPMRFKAFHILHEPMYFGAILALIKPFMSEKIRSRIHTHGNDLKSLHRHIPKSILPAEYGGTQGRFDNTKWREQILNDQEYFTRLETYSYDPKQIKPSITESKKKTTFNGIDIDKLNNENENGFLINT